jgi:hypothetical protein
MNWKTSLTLSLLFVALSAPLSARVAEAGEFKLRATIPIPPASPGGKLEFFDISFVDASTQKYVLADRSNAGVDIVDSKTNTFVHRIGGFAGQKFNANGSADNAHSGPDGVLVIPGVNQIWAGDGDSTVKVFSLLAPYAPIATISTCLPGNTVANCARADEMAYDPDDNILIVANNAATPDAFVTLISTTSMTVLGHIVFNAATGAPFGIGAFSGGIEQSVWNSATGRFYVSVPEVDVNASTPTPTKGAVAVIDPLAMTITDLFPVNDCNPAGLALGPSQQLLLGCGLKNGQSVIMDAQDGHIVKVVYGVGGSDEVWFNPGDNHYYLAARNNVVVDEQGLVVVDANGNAVAGGVDPVLGVIDAATNTLVQKVATGTPTRSATSAHSVAADPLNKHVFVPLPPNAPCPTGCIGVYWSEEPNIVALTATPSGDGIVNIPGPTGTGVFAVATTNTDGAGDITFSADTGGVSLPLILSVCQTNSATGACLAPPSSSVTVHIVAGGTSTFSVFVTGTGVVPYDPANVRVIARFTDGSGATVGSASVAARTK